MTSDAFHHRQASGMGDAIVALIARDGSAQHPLPKRLRRLPLAMRDLCDAVYGLSALHGAFPGIIDIALMHHAHPAMQDWLVSAAERFAAERLYLTQLIAAAGPLPSTPGQAETETALVGQRHAIETLAKSDRTGCATGAAIALLLDWSGSRPVLDLAARRFGVDPAPFLLPGADEIAAATDGLIPGLAIERALSFGAQQLIAQHHGLWDLLEARSSARDRP